MAGVRTDGFMSFSRVLGQSETHLCSGFELGSPVSFPTKITLMLNPSLKILTLYTVFKKNTHLLLKLSSIPGVPLSFKALKTIAVEKPLCVLKLSKRSHNISRDHC